MQKAITAHEHKYKYYIIHIQDSKLRIHVQALAP